jgi:hypothetical protein
VDRAAGAESGVKLARPINYREYPPMKATHKLNRLAVALAAGLALTTAHAADITPAETKAIAEEGFIYGLPIVTNYAVMYQYAVDKNSGQFQAPFNHIFNEARVFTYKDTAIVTPNSDTPYSFLWLDLRAEPILLSVPLVEKSRYYAVQLEDANTFNFGYIGSRSTGSEAGDYRWPDRLERRNTCRASRRCFVPARNSR